MGMKFLNKKGWHTGSLRNIENVWKAEQKHEAEQKKLEELKKQIHEERERAEFRQLQEQAGLIPKQERLDFLYESGLAVGKGSSSFKALESLPKTDPETTASSSASVKQQQQPAVPGALFEEKEKPQSANDAWRKLHSDPLLMIRQREQEALARVKNNPVQMAMIRKSVESKKDKDKDEKKQKSKHHKKKSKHRKHSSSENDSDPEDAHLAVEKQRERHQKGSNSDKPSRKATHDSDEEFSKRDDRRKKYDDNEYKHQRPSEAPNTKSDPEDAHWTVEKQRERHQKGSNSDKPSRKATHDSDEEFSKRDDRRKKYDDNEDKHQRPSEAPNMKSDPEDAHLTVEKQRERHQKGSNSDKPSHKATHNSDEEFSKRDDRRKKYDDHEYKHRRPSEAPNTKSDPEDAHLAVEKQRERHQKGSNSDKPSRKANHDSDEYSKRDDRRKKYYDNEYKHRRPSEAPNMKYDRSEGRHEKPPHITSSDKPPRNESNNRHRKSVKLSEEERAARLREMQMDAERHEQQRWKRLKKAADSDAQETIRDNASMGRNFLDAAQKSVFGAEKGGSSTIEESVRRRTHYSQGKSASESNAFRR